MSDHIETDIKTLRGELEDLREDLKNIAFTLQTLVRHGKTEAGTKFEDICEQLPDNLKKLTAEAKTHIEEKPLSSALASFGVGMLLGLLLNGSRTPPGRP